MAVLILFLSLFLVRETDRFRRSHFWLTLSKNTEIPGIYVVPSRKGDFPLAIGLHDRGGSALGSGRELRTLAEADFAAVDLDYPLEQSAFDETLLTMMRLKVKLPWTGHKEAVWIGSGLSAEWLYSFAVKHPEFRPQLLVLVNFVPKEALAPENPIGSVGSGRPPTRILVVRDGTFASAVHDESPGDPPESGHFSYEEIVFPENTLGSEAERMLVWRGIAEYCARFFKRERVPVDPNSSWIWWTLMLLGFSLAVYFLRRWRNERKSAVAQRGSRKGRILFGLACLLAVAAAGQTLIHLLLPQAPFSKSAIPWVRRTLDPELPQGAFDYLQAQPIWHGQKIDSLLTHLRLAEMQRKFFYPDAGENYEKFILSPAIGDHDPGDLNWRRLLWENFYPRIRHEKDTLSATRIVVRFLRERVSIVRDRKVIPGVCAAWRNGFTDVPGFESLYVAALRSVGIAARLDQTGRTEFLTNDSGTWRPAPRPLFEAL